MNKMWIIILLQVLFLFSYFLTDFKKSANDAMYFYTLIYIFSVVISFFILLVCYLFQKNKKVLHILFFIFYLYFSYYLLIFWRIVYNYLKLL